VIVVFVFSQANCPSRGIKKLVVDYKSLSAEALTKHVVETGPGNKIHSYIKITSAETFKAD